MCNFIVPGKMYPYFVVAVFVALCVSLAKVPGISEVHTYVLLRIVAACIVFAASSMYLYLFLCHYRYLQKHKGNGHSTGVKFQVRLDSAQTMGLRFLTMLGILMLLLFSLIDTYYSHVGIWAQAARCSVKFLIILLGFLELANVIRQIRIEKWLGDHAPERTDA